MDHVTEWDSARHRVRRFRAIVGVVAISLVIFGGVAGAVLLLNTPGRTVERAEEAKQQAAKESVARAERRMKTFTSAWERGKWDVAGQYTDSPGSAASLLASMHRNLAPRPFSIEVGRPTASSSTRSERKSGAKAYVVPFTVRMKVPRVGTYTYESKARIVQTAARDVVHFEPSMVHPALKVGQTLAVARMSTRGSILDRTGDVLAAATLVGEVDANGRGTSGLEKRYDKQLTGSGSGSAYLIAITDRETGRAVRPLRTPDAKLGKDVHTTIDPDVQRAAANALGGVTTPAALVALKPSTGDILAVANEPAGYNRAFIGEYPPGSTFKVITSAALLRAGLSPSDVLECPRYEWVYGWRFTNQNEFVLPEGSTFRDAFAHSCNTAFVGARDKLDDRALARTAAAFGIGGVWDTGASTYDGSVPVNTDVLDRSAAMIGQGRDLASPLVMASVAGTVKNGKFVQPRLVPEAVRHPYQAPESLDPNVVTDLRSMMRSVVTDGAGEALRGLPGRPHAKTGTAEYGNASPRRTHAWMIGYQEDSDLAWAVLLEDGGSGGSDAGPVAAAFLKNLTGKGPS
ncbi:penicillin-binding transpeptidase domain-containing protein [Actinopolymorpha singaporensis]|uniref:NTF2-like N-terminal transpeptidase domain-containing protein n=1 Tax=Actinopolymorpha singaporensis TaxID=117157 RepID=A0A1H1RBW2_9ACTN|nr:penicillin-binding transpeptidase domain-containing protein [Actinopolymorpha singaporensis]SDS32419.1 NTF2-like N-terminal transpeptidase domain-containing protein [Actinopolymorpha singaporensis]